jgi:site-specific recombinase XerD
MDDGRSAIPDDVRQLALFGGVPRATDPAGGAVHTGGPDSGNAPPTRLAPAVDAYVTFQASIGRSHHTLRATRADLGALARFLGDRPLAEVSVGDLQRFLADGALRGRPAPRSQRRRTATVKVFFRHAQAEGWTDRDPAARLVYAEVDARPPMFLAEDELDRLALAAERNPFWQAAVLALADAGLKRDELLALEVADVYLDPRHPERSYLVVRQTDRARRIRARRIALTPRLTAALPRVVDDRAGRAGRLFGVTPAAVNFMLESLTRLAGLGRVERVTPQMLRETFAVGAAGRFARAEALAARSRTEEEQRALRIEHDRALSELLGLSTDDPANLAQVARKYRRLCGDVG